MKYYLAPMEGITTYIFRNAYHRHFGGVDKYFTPFLANKGLSSRERNDVLPEHNTGIPLVPQILTNRAEEFLAIAEQLADYGYTTVNLNLGCPSGTVVARKRGAGFLSIPDELDHFLDEIYRKCPLEISIKTRIGMSAPEEWEGLLSIYEKYPVSELIIHPRLQTEGYKGTPHREAYARAEECLQTPLCYNGDIDSAAAKDGLLQEFPQISAVMIGRGILKRPGLLSELKVGKTASTEGFTLSDQSSQWPIGTNLETLKAFHDEILEGYIEIMSGDQPTLFKMKDLWTFLSSGFENSEKCLKKIRKANRIGDYRSAVEEVFAKGRLYYDKHKTY